MIDLEKGQSFGLTLNLFIYIRNPAPFSAEILQDTIFSRRSRLTAYLLT